MAGFQHQVGAPEDLYLPLDRLFNSLNVKCIVI